MKKLQDTHKYDDIIHLQRPVSPRHAPMSNYDRAAQFSPFAALTGYEDVIGETGRLTDTEAVLDDSGVSLLNDKLLAIMANIAQNPRISVTYFRDDQRKSGGAYLKITGNVKKIDTYEGVIFLTDERTVPIDRIHDLELLT